MAAALPAKPTGHVPAGTSTQRPHGDYDKYTASDVDGFIRDVRAFSIKHPAQGAPLPREPDEQFREGGSQRAAALLDVRQRPSTAESALLGVSAF